MVGTIEASVHERRLVFFFPRINRTWKGEGAHLHASPDGQTLHLKVYGCFAHGVGTGVSCTPKLSLCDATICVVVLDFLWPLWLGGRQAGTSHFSYILHALDVILQKSSNGQHRHAAAVGKHTWLEPPYPPKILEMTLSRLR